MINPTDLFVAVVSANRPGQVEPMTEQLGPLNATWFVPEDQTPVYRASGATRVTATHGNHPQQRNIALDAAFTNNQPILMLDDDLRSMKIKHDDGFVQDATLTDAITRLTETWHQVDAAHLAGTNPSSNPFYAKPPFLKPRHFVRASLMIIRPTPLRFDPNIIFKDDYDYTLQHLNTYGAVCRDDSIIPDFDYSNLPGGLQTIRTQAAMIDNVTKLRTKWGPDIIRPNVKRGPTEILLRWKP